MRHVISHLVIILAACASLLADVGRPVERTPRDRPFGTMRQVYFRFEGGDPSISDVRAALRTAHRFRYYFDWSDPYTPQLPAVTESRQQADCKAKSLWLADKMGTRNARYVVGKVRLDSQAVTRVVDVALRRPMAPARSG